MNETVLESVKLGVIAIVLAFLGWLLLRLLFVLVEAVEKETPRFEANWGGLGGGLGGWAANKSLTLCFLTMMVLLALVSVLWQVQPKDKTKEREKAGKESKSAESLAPAVTTTAPATASPRPAEPAGAGAPAGEPKK
jgi:hypothetical protein